ncbi:hypothetical protein FQR65_LT15053 [Abscondita terminalis]|nr:hypothetical protein FQR65_LT15053 [Abscondita terminalis]
MCSKKRIKWTNESESALLDLWEEKITDLRRQKRNSHVYTEMATQLKLCFVGNELEGVEGNDIKTKINNFTQNTRSEKKVIGPSGGKRSGWKYYDKINKILGSLPCNDPSLVFMLEDEVSNSDNQNNEHVPESEESHSSNSQRLPMTPSSSSSSTSGSAAFCSSEKKKILKRKRQDFDELLLQEIRRIK